MAPRLGISFEGAARTVTGSRHSVGFGERSWPLPREESELWN